MSRSLVRRDLWKEHKTGDLRESPPHCMEKTTGNDILLPWKLPNVLYGLENIEMNEFDDYVDFHEFSSVSLSAEILLPSYTFTNSYGQDETEIDVCSCAKQTYFDSEWKTYLKISFAFQENSFRHLKTRKIIFRSQNNKKKYVARYLCNKDFDKKFVIWNLVTKKPDRTQKNALICIKNHSTIIPFAAGCKQPCSGIAFKLTHTMLLIDDKKNHQVRNKIISICN